MPDTSIQTSFSRRRRWSIAVHVVVALTAVLAIVIMLNYFSSRVYKRIYVSSNQRTTLSPRTLSILQSLTNNIQITLYYPKDADLYTPLVDLLKEYKAHSHGKIQLRVVDYLRDTADAQEVSTKYNLGSATNLIIFSCEGKRPWIVPGDQLMEMKLVPLPSDDPNKLAFEKKRIAFRGEVVFSGSLLAVTDPKPFKAYYLEGDDEHKLDDSKYSYASFAGLVLQNLVQLQTLNLVGTNDVPADCDLLIVAGPLDRMLPPRVSAIERYLNEGGRLLALFNIASTNKDIGLENVLTNWGVQVSKSQVIGQFANPDDAGSVLVFEFPRHPAVAPLTGRTVEFLLPRMICQNPLPSPAGDGLKVDEIVWTGPKSILATAREGGMTNLPIAVAVEQSARKQRGSTRIIVVGDSIFLSNPYIGLGANREFASLALNWLLERNALLEGVGPKNVEEYRLVLSASQLTTAKWVLLAGMPGAVLLFGGLVWLRRRK